MTFAPNGRGEEECVGGLKDVAIEGKSQRKARGPIVDLPGHDEKTDKKDMLCSAAV